MREQPAELLSTHSCEEIPDNAQSFLSDQSHGIFQSHQQGVHSQGGHNTLPQRLTGVIRQGLHRKEKNLLHKVVFIRPYPVRIRPLVNYLTPL